VVQDFIKSFKNVVLINKRNQGCKAAPVNAALKLADTDLFGCVDADSTVDKNSLKLMIQYFDDPKTASVITAVKVSDPRNLWERLQRMEYIMAILSRKLRASINTLAMTPGVLSVYRTDVLKQVGGFDQKNITEDFEIALRLRYHNYNIMIEPRAITYTKVPDTLRSLWRQRIRWYRGYIFNHIKYKDMFFNKKYGLLGYFQLPLNILGIGLLFGSIGLISYSLIDHFSEVFIRLLTIDGYLSNLFYIPTLKEFVLSHNLKLMIPIFIQFAEFSLAGKLLLPLQSLSQKLIQAKDKRAYLLLKTLKIQLEPQTQRMIINDLKSNNTSNQKKAIQFLGCMGDASIPILIDLIKKEEDFRIRNFAISLLEANHEH